MLGDRRRPAEQPDGGAPCARWTRITWPTGNGSARKLAAAIAACLCVVVSGVSATAVSAFVATAGGPARRAADAGKTAVTVTTRARPATVPGAFAHGTRAPGGANARPHLRWSPRLARQMRRWAAGRGAAAMAAVAGQLAIVRQTAAVGQYAAARLACVSLASSVRSASAGPPIPEHGMQGVYAGELARLWHAAAACQHAISTRARGDESAATQVNKAMLNRSLAVLAGGSKELYLITADLRLP